VSLANPIYVSGPMTGYPSFNHEAFAAACKALRGLGYTVLSPHEVGEGGVNMEWADYIRKDLPMLAQARSVVVLEGWECSRGARLEVHIAQAMSMAVVPLAVALRSGSVA